MRIAVGNRPLVSNRLTVSNGLAVVHRTLIGNGTLLVGDYRTLIGNRALVGHGTLWLTFVHGALLVSDRARLVGDTGILAGLRLVRYRSTVIGDGPTVVRCVWSVGMTFVCAQAVSGSCCSGACSGSGTSTGGRTGCGFLVAVGVHVGIKFIGLLELIFVLEALLPRETIAFGGIGIQLLRLGGFALGFCGLDLGVGIGLLRFGFATLGIRFPSMNFMLGLGVFLADP